MKENSKGITKKQVIEAYGMLKKYCRQQKRCKGCFLFTGEDDPENFCMVSFNENQIPAEWQDLEL